MNTRTALVTGVGSGIGREIALDLTRRGWRLILPVRSTDRADDLKRFAHAAEAPGPLVIACDLADPAQVADMCDTAADSGPLDLVINSAAVGGGSDPSLRQTNTAGVELRMAVNAVAPHLIARSLAASLAPAGRIVQVGSFGQSPLPLDDLNFERDYEGVEAYCRSKLALVMSTRELAARGLHINVVHPAHAMPTTMVRQSRVPVASTLDDGTLAVLRVALDTALHEVTGMYFDRFTTAAPHPQADEPATCERVVKWLENAAAFSR